MEMDSLVAPGALTGSVKGGKPLTSFRDLAVHGMWYGSTQQQTARLALTILDARQRGLEDYFQLQHASCPRP